MWNSRAKYIDGKPLCIGDVFASRTAYAVRCKEGWLQRVAGFSHHTTHEEPCKADFYDTPDLVLAASSEYAISASKLTVEEIVEFEIFFVKSDSFKPNDPELRRRKLQAQIDRLQTEMANLK